MLAGQDATKTEFRYLMKLAVEKAAADSLPSWAEIYQLQSSHYPTQ
jgi:hypothetical protein